MAGLKTLLGLYPKTRNYETKRNQLEEEYNSLIEYESSEEFARYNELDSYLKSEEFSSTKKELLSLKYRNSAEFNKERELAILKKDKSITLYLKSASSNALTTFQKLEDSEKLKSYKKLQEVISSEEFQKVKKYYDLSGEERFKQSDLSHTLEGYNKQKESDRISAYKRVQENKSTDDADKAIFEELKGSDELEAFLDLEKFVNSSDFKNQRSEIERKTFRDTEEYKSQEEYDKLHRDSEIQSFIKYESSEEYKSYKNLVETEKFKKFKELTELVNSQEFIERKNYLNLSANVRWNQSEACQKEKEYKAILKSGKIKWFKKTKGHKKFAWLRSWDITFQDDFEGVELNRDKWLTRYYWAEELLQESYSLLDEMHCITDGENLELNGSILKIITRKQTKEGKIWRDDMGFAPHEFEYTSGLINTGKSFRQKYGLFEARIKVAQNTDLLNAFWMVGDQMLPHLDIFKAYDKCSVGIIANGSSAQKALKRTRFADEFHIVSMEWEPNKIIWRINGLEVTTMTTNIPQEEMYLAFSSGLYKDVTGIPASMEIDWVKCYKKHQA